MDYKELINGLRYGEWGVELIYNAATAIETLLAERGAAVEELRGICWCCAYGKPWDKASPFSKTTTCEHMQELGALARSGGKCKCPHWQWRGPQSEEADTP